MNLTEKKVNYYLHRINYEWEVAYPLFDMGYLTYGWHDYMAYNLEEMIENDPENGFEKFSELSGIKNYRNHHCLKRFVSMNAGDIVVVPFNKEFAICEVLESSRPIGVLAGTKITKKSNKDNAVITADTTGIPKTGGGYYDIGHVIKVKIIRNEIPRNYANASLNARMKFRMANLQINDLSKDIEDACKAQSPVSVYEKIIEETRPVFYDVFKKWVQPEKFEEIIKAYMLKSGATTVDIPAKNESGKKDKADADVVAVFEDLKIIIYVQAKRHDGITGEWGVEQIRKYKEQKAEEDSRYTYLTWVISSAEDFSKETFMKAREYNVRLINRSEFAKMLLNEGIGNLYSLGL